ncbi:hypothetical protein GEMRC1_002776 [Eukaryota sp. GEM-RC1]
MLYTRDTYNVYPNYPQPFELIIDLNEGYRYIKPAEGPCTRDRPDLRNRELQLKAYNIPDHAVKTGETTIGSVKCQLFRGNATMLTESGGEVEVPSEWCTSNRFLHMWGTLEGEVLREFYYNQMKVSDNDLFNPDKLCDVYVDM